jgi:hypothetical protein
MTAVVTDTEATMIAAWRLLLSTVDRLMEKQDGMDVFITNWGLLQG